MFAPLVRRWLGMAMAVGAAAAAAGAPVEPAGGTLEVFAPVTLGAAAGRGPGGCAVAELGGGRWAVLWLDPAGRIVQATGRFDGPWSEPTPALADAGITGITAIALSGDARTGWRLTAQPADGPAAAWRRRSWAEAWQPA
ncbi:MAG: hypothetical protein JNG83_07525, partial [Opitutaceae bacterium]|nr:hypothetical protein [Opitutaceae bacterium]